MKDLIVKNSFIAKITVKKAKRKLFLQVFPIFIGR